MAVMTVGRLPDGGEIVGCRREQLGRIVKVLQDFRNRPLVDARNEQGGAYGEVHAVGHQTVDRGRGAILATLIH